MSRCDHIGQTDEARHVVLCAAGYSVLWLLRIIRKEGISHFLSIIEARGFATSLRVIQSPAPSNRLPASSLRLREPSLDQSRVFWNDYLALTIAKFPLTTILHGY